MVSKRGGSFDVVQNGICVTTITNSYDFSPNTYSARIFAARHDLQLTGRLYGAKMWDNGVLVRNFIPCKLANGTIGAYDIANFKFYGNAGSGTFIGGPELSGLPEEYTRLDYIQSTGNQYINTGIRGNATDKFELIMDVAYTFQKTGDNTWDKNIHQIMGFNGHRGCGVGPAGNMWWDHSLISTSIKQNHYKHVEWWGQANNCYTYADGESQSRTDAAMSATSGSNLNLFGTHYTSSDSNIGYWSYCKMYSSRILVNGSIVRNFIPCLHPNGTPGLYDSITHTFYANNGSGKFIGPTNGGLPVGYLPVEYIQSFGAQWLDSELRIATNTWIETDLMFSSAFGYNMMFGQWDNLSLSLKAENEVCMGVGGGSTQNLGSPTVSNVKYNFIVGPGQGLIQNGTRYSIGGNANDTSVDGPIFIFAASDSGAPYQPWSWSGYGQGKIYNLKIYEGTTGNVETSKLRRHFIPCVTSAGIPGMYDLVEQKFHFNKGTGAFAAGPIVSALAHGYTKLTAIESNGTQYINTQYCPATENLMYVLDFKQSPIGANTSLFGSEYNGDGSSRQWSIVGYESGGGDISYYVGSSSAVSSDYPAANVRHRLFVHAHNGTFRHDLDASSKTVTYAGSLLKSYPIGLFANDAENVYHQRSSMQTYAFQISDGGVLVRAFTPCMNASGEGGLYDYITGLFFGNGGTGSLIPRSPISDAIKHKTLVNGTAYEIIGGRAMVDGTIHDLINGRTLVNGTAYSIPLRANVIEIALNANGGAGGTSKIYYHYGKNAFFADAECWTPLTQIVAPTRSGYKFLGYNGNGSNGADASETYIFSDLSFSSNLCTKIYKSTTLTAQWGENVYTISFDANGGSTGTASKDVQYNKAIGTLPTPTRSGYYFIGWYDANYKDDPWLYYAEAPNNGDLINAFGYDRLKLAQHYWEYGLKESWRRKTQHIDSDIYTTAGNSTFYAGWAPIFTITQSVYNASDYSDSKDLAWDDYEGYRTLTINGSGDLAAHSGSQSAIYGQKIYILAANKYSQRLSNIYINSVQPSDVQYRTWTEQRGVVLPYWPFYETRTYTVDAAEWSSPISSNWKVEWTFDTEGDIFSITGSPQAFWDCSISTNQ